ncbi:MAG: UvrD-helicase domain-containing protein [Chloroflexi bacterium]|nr:UvrD-helicase domain-containing protein [Chloroflexota bacterium]
MTAPIRFVPRDEEARRRIRESLDETLFVEAGAGTGKTTSLVERIVALVSTGTTTLDKIVAITFTRAAAAELRDRVRESLELAATGTDLSEAEATRCRQGITDLDQASIQTIDGFATSLLREKPLEAGLPPSFDVHDQISADLSFEETWSRWLDGAFEDPDLADALSVAFSLGMTTTHLRDLAKRLHESYDRVVGPALNDVPMPQPGSIALLEDRRADLERLCGFSQKREDDKLYIRVQEVLQHLNKTGDTNDDPAAGYRWLNRLPSLRVSRTGRQTDWDDDPDSGENACIAVRKTLEDANADVESDLTTARSWALDEVLRALTSFVAEYAEERKRRGVAEFHDLLVWARDLLRDDIEVRDHFRDRFTHILIDEVQDTDPIQTEIALFLAEEASAATPDEDRPRQWDAVRPEPGKLFVVGDQKQSIYRFRGADVRQMARFQAHLDTEPVRLVQNFRSQRPVLDWVNFLFERMMEGEEQADYHAVAHIWEASTGHALSPRVWSMGDDTGGTHINPVRWDEARNIAALLADIARGDWQVLNEEQSKPGENEVYRKAALSDVCILMPRRTGLPALEVALEDAGVPYRLEGASLVFASQEVNDIVNCMRAIDDPSNQVATVAALRTPAFACSDEDLLRHSLKGGGFDYLTPEGAPDGHVADSLKELLRFHGERLWASPASLIDRFIRKRLLMATAVDDDRMREQWRRYRFMVEQARAFFGAGGESLRAFLQWIDRQREEGARVSEAPAPEGDEDAVKVMTVHSAKGLEFPIVVLTGLNGQPRFRAGEVLFPDDRAGLEARVGSGDSEFKTPGYGELFKKEKALSEQEAVRLLYVATTRARDHLVVSVYRTGKDGASAAAQIATILEDRPALWEPLPGFLQTPAPETAAGEGELDIAKHSLEERDRWEKERAETIARRGKPVSIAATRIASIAKEEAAGDEPWRRGRAGTSIGRAVHAVLQTIDLESGALTRETAQAQASAEGIPKESTNIEKLVDTARTNPIVKRALASGRYWREVPVATPIGDGALEGIIDLLFEEDDGFVIVDYKTDSLPDDETETAMQRYRLQGGAYALALQEAVGRPVKEVVFLFLHPNKAETLTDLKALTEEAREVALEHVRVD